MSAAGKYNKYIILLLLIAAGAYGVNTFILNPQGQQGVAMTFNKSTKTMNLYDDSLPSDVDYHWLIGSNGRFTAQINTTDYATGTTPQETIKQFNDKQAAKSYLDTVRMLNIVRNILKYMLDMELKDFHDTFKDAFYWGTGGHDHAVNYYFSRYIEGVNTDRVSLQMLSDYYTNESSLVWELIIKRDNLTNTYETILTRMPKP